MALTLSIELLTGRYVASEFANRNRPEWPPHPARLFSALVASHFEGSASPEGEQALRWLEAQPAPALAFSAAHPRDLKTHFVPVNDQALTDSSSIGKAWERVFAARESGQEKSITKEEEKLTALYAKAGAAKSSIGKSDPGAGAHLLPDSRKRQARTFPSVTPDSPLIHFTWPEAPDASIRRGLDQLTRTLARLGHSSSLISACWKEDDPPTPTLVESPAGKSKLRWVSEGQLDALVARHQREPHAEQRLLPHRMVSYGRPLLESAQDPLRSCFSEQFVVLRRVKGPRLPSAASEVLAEAVRQALMCHADDPVPALISGHQVDGAPLQSDHLAIAPLPYVAGTHASGELLGVALIWPNQLDSEQFASFYRAVARWEESSEGGPEHREVDLALGQLGAWTLQREIESSSLYNLREETWTGPSRYWRSATPVVLDRHPGSFKKQRARAERRAHEAMISACQRIGLPTPEAVEFSDAPLLEGAEHAKRYIRRAGTTDKRPLVHASIHFSEPVLGPVLLGAGRYRGLGLFRPIGGPRV